MLRTSSRISETVHNPQGLSQRLQNAIAQFWRFSSFYGDYQSLPPAERRRFVLDRQKRDQ
ncbi:hypothetical protein IQ265_19900 [Nodosilinea sp. LEGE 06152]|uniref:hypothetical protein n=1 Tax=Nodosilinea sp. LEGE 06152 TaxID=2777966 RepID=UPI00188120DE|nr:hypothetical protein [Nodosilinea sp. LEGE 06152]MBE9159080.1 hypothetical protein [Nodosilinea sp. LEGE 06152]